MDLPRSTPFVLILSAPSATGKTTLSHLLSQHVPNMKRGITYTTRPKRNGERQGVDYYFVSEQEFQQRAQKGEFLEYGKIYGYCYGTGFASLRQMIDQGHDVVLILDTLGAMRLKQKWPHCSVSVFLLPPCMQELKARLVGRGTHTPHQVLQRLQCAKSEMRFGLQHFQYVVANTDLEQTLEDLKAIVRVCRLQRRDWKVWQNRCCS